MKSLSNGHGGVCVENGIAAFWRGGVLFAEELLPMSFADAKAGVILATGNGSRDDDWLGVTASAFINRDLTERRAAA